MSTSTATERIGAKSPLKLKYFDLKPLGGPGGRGGAVRFFLLAAGIDFEDEKVVYGESWPAVKQDLVKSGEAPCGVVPVVTLNDTKLTESHAIMRRFSKQLGLYGDDLERDFLIDSLADASVAWRWQWVAAAVGDDAAKEKHKTSERPANYSAFETLLERSGASGAFTVQGGKLSLADALVFGQLWDDVVVFGDSEIKQKPHLLSFYKAFLAQPAVAAWCQDQSPSNAAAVSQL